MKTNTQSGFTLVELLIYIGIFALISISIISFVVRIIDINAKNYVIQEVNANARLALEVMSDRIRTASDVNVGSSTFETDPGILSLEMEDASLDPTVIDLSVDDGRLRITQGSDAPIFLTSNRVSVTDLQFKDVTTAGLKNSILVTITVAYASPSSKAYEYEVSLQTTVTLRK